MLNLSDTPEVLDPQQKDLVQLHRKLQESQKKIQDLTAENTRLLGKPMESTPRASKLD